MNILSNAIQAIPGEGKIFIKTWQVGDMVKVSIRDTGTGMTEEIRKKIYDPFFTTKDVGKGTGLGLYISYGIIEKHNGKIEVFSQLGEGTEFVITIPIQQQTTV
jgi:signal transduction histidine kinase